MNFRSEELTVPASGSVSYDIEADDEELKRLGFAIENTGADPITSVQVHALPAGAGPAEMPNMGAAIGAVPGLSTSDFVSDDSTTYGVLRVTLSNSGGNDTTAVVYGRWVE